MIAPEVPATAPARKPRGKRAMYVVRRGHLYLGLFLLPWAILYGVTAFLFNHPTAFSDAPTTSFGADLLRGTPMEGMPTPADTAGQVVAVMNARAADGLRYTLAPEPAAEYVREFVSATVKVDDGSQVGVLLEIHGLGGTVRGQPARPEVKTVAKAPFALGTTNPARLNNPPEGRTPHTANPDRADTLQVAGPLHERVKAAVPTILERTGFAGGEVAVAAVPDLVFCAVDSRGKTWKVTANTLTGTLNGVPAEDVREAKELGVRRFLLRLHLAHGYPAGGGARWWWAVIVDAMAFVLVFWGISGLLMWWQIKATRKLGVLALILSGTAAGWLAFGMFDVLSR